MPVHETRNKSLLYRSFEVVLQPFLAVSCLICQHTNEAIVTLLTCVLINGEPALDHR